MLLWLKKYEANQIFQSFSLEINELYHFWSDQKRRDEVGGYC
jgi:hypothetical protein